MIVVDDREVTQHPEIPELLPEVTVDRMEGGDYCFLDSSHQLVGIERAEVSNLVQKVRSGELEEQMSKCAELYSHTILLTEGVYDSIDGLLALYGKGTNGYFRKHVFARTQYNFVSGVLTRLSDMGVELLNTPNFNCSMETIRVVVQSRTRSTEQHSLFTRTKFRMPTKLTKNPAVPMLMGLCPRLNEKVAIRLIHKYDTVWAVLHAEDSELLTVEGFGKGMLEKLKRGVGKTE